MTGGAAQNVHVTPGYGSWKLTSSRSTRTKRPKSSMMKAARGKCYAKVRDMSVMMMIKCKNSLNRKTVNTFSGVLQKFRETLSILV